MSDRSELDRKISQIADQLSALDLELFAAEKDDDVTAQVVALRARGRVWRSWADHLERTGRDATPAILASQRDAISADRLADGAL